MMVRYTYNRQVTPPAPFVHVTVRPPIEGPSGVVVPAQLDTGADLSVIPLRLVDELQLVPCGRSPLLHQLGQGCNIASHESQGTEVLPELSAFAGAVGCPRGAAEGA